MKDDDVQAAPEASLRAADPGELIAELAHSIRSRLTAVLFVTDTLRGGRTGELDDNQRRQLALAYGAALSASCLAASVTDLMRQGDDLRSLRPEPFLVTDLFESVRTSIAPIADVRGLSVRLIAPETDRRLGHRVALDRTLLNLAVTVLEFTDQGFIELAAHTAGPNRLVLSVHASTGEIDPDTLSRLDQPVQPRESGEGFRWSLAGAAIASARTFARPLGGHVRFEVLPETGLQIGLELDLPPAEPS